MKNNILKWMMMVLESLKMRDMKDTKIHVVVKVDDKQTFSKIFDGKEVYQDE